MDKRYKDVRQLFDFATNIADELLEDHPNYSAHEILTLACEIAIHNYYESPSTELPVGHVDTKKMAFVLQDGDSAALIAGDLEFAIGTGKTVYAKDPEHVPEDENEEN